MQFYKKKIFGDISFFHKTLIFSNISILLMQYNMPEFFKEFGEILPFLILFLPILLIGSIFISDLYYLVTKQLNEKKDFIVIFDKTLFYLVVGILHIILSILQINSYNDFIIGIYLVFLFLGVLYLIRYRLFQKLDYIKNKKSMFKKSKYVVVVMAIIFQIFTVNEKVVISIIDNTTQKIQNYLSKGKGKSHLIYDEKINQIVY